MLVIHELAKVQNTDPKQIGSMGHCEPSDGVNGGKAPEAPAILMYLRPENS